MKVFIIIFFFSCFLVFFYLFSLFSPGYISRFDQIPEEALSYITQCFRDGIESGMIRLQATRRFGWTWINDGVWRNLTHNGRNAISHSVSDAADLVKYLLLKSQASPGGVFDIQMDGSRLRSLFFMFEEQVQLGIRFGDVVVADCTYKCNAQNMKLLLFTSIDDELKSFVVAYALVTYEDANSYQFCLRSLFKALGSTPQTFFTDQDRSLVEGIHYFLFNYSLLNSYFCTLCIFYSIIYSIIYLFLIHLYIFFNFFHSAISIVFPACKHFLCVFHVDQSISRALRGHLPGVFHEFYAMWIEATRGTFESDDHLKVAILRIADAYPVTRAYINTHIIPIVPQFCYHHVNKFFTLQLHSTGRGEKLNDLCKRYAHHNTKLVALVGQLETQLHGYMMKRIDTYQRSVRSIRSGVAPSLDYTSGSLSLFLSKYSSFASSILSAQFVSVGKYELTYHSLRRNPIGLLTNSDCIYVLKMRNRFLQDTAQNKEVQVKIQLLDFPSSDSFASPIAVSKVVKERYIGCNSACFECSACPRVVQFGIPCKHIFFVNSFFRLPSIRDIQIHPRWKINVDQILMGYSKNPTPIPVQVPVASPPSIDVLTPLAIEQYVQQFDRVPISAGVLTNKETRAHNLNVLCKVAISEGCSSVKSYQLATNFLNLLIGMQKNTVVSLPVQIQNPNGNTDPVRRPLISPAPAPAPAANKPTVVIKPLSNKVIGVPPPSNGVIAVPVQNQKGAPIVSNKPAVPAPVGRPPAPTVLNKAPVAVSGFESPPSRLEVIGNPNNQAAQKGRPAGTTRAVEKSQKDQIVCPFCGEVGHKTRRSAHCLAYV